LRAAVYEEFKGPITIREVADPVAPPNGVVLRVRACGICRSDWHGWMGNDPDITLPHVPGHELAGEIASVGARVSRFRVGDRVTLPFVCGCGTCEHCRNGDQQICDRHLVRLPDEIDFVTAASLGCRFATSFRAVVDQGRIQPGQWVAVYGCGGVGLSAIMIAAAFGTRVIAVDIADDKLEFARTIGAEIIVNSTLVDAVSAIRDITSGGAHVSIDALGHPEVLLDSISCLRKRGKHIQIGIMEAGRHLAAVPIDKIIGRELEIFGSHGMQAHRYPEMIEMVRDGRLEPAKLIGRTVSLDESPRELATMSQFGGAGVTVIDQA
jgi:alcohol dehydrogenase